MDIKELAYYGTSVGGLIIIVCLLIFLIMIRKLGTDERADFILLKTYKLMFTILTIFILGSIFLGIGNNVTGIVYQNLTVAMFAVSFLIGVLYLIILDKKN